MIPTAILDTINKMSNPLVVSHRGCRDGWMAAFLAALRWPDAKILLQNPKEEPLYLEAIDRDVLVLDLYLKRDQLVNLKSAAKSLVSLDHHDDSMLAMEGLEFCYHDRARSGAGLALDAFFPGARDRYIAMYHYVRTDMSLPSVIYPQYIEAALHVEDWDLWKFSLPGTKEIAAYLDTLPKTVEAWKTIPSASHMAERGRAVLAYVEQQVERVAESARVVSWPAWEGKDEKGNPISCPAGDLLAVNAITFQSEVGSFLYGGKAPAPLKTVLCYYQTNRGDWKCSLRSANDGANVNHLAKRFGGGGHEHSAGFTANTLEEALSGAVTIRGAFGVSLDVPIPRKM